ncbi:hypothetical protein [Pararobbsia alpina]|uniref:Uncharacterized protein n=1 Tax=Pararobbsia alpina TaxID=621374 RepID=A0A6S7C2F5_9BURK|nr:hypothetical protein [Pararobbsia alpina]CAB3799796.1 hypothetical protein LMG28138_04731 [Pararobbsia alpina]
MFKTAMEVDAALGAVWRMPRGNLVNSLVRSFVRTCIRTAGQSQRVAAARAAAHAVAARTTAAARTPVRPSAHAASPVFGAGLALSGVVSQDLSHQGLSLEDWNPQAPAPDASASRNPACVESAVQRSERQAPVAAATLRPMAIMARAIAVAPASEPAFARVSSRRGAQPATLNPVRIYSTPSRTVMVGNLSEVARFLDDSIERERARLAMRVQRGNIQARAS